MPRPLKVFQAHLGFYDTAVAAPSRAAALKAWGSRQNLFREGVASETKDAQAVTAALAKPGVVLRRPVGTNAPFSENPDLPNVPKLPKKAPPAKTQAKSVPPPKPPPRHEPPQLRLVPSPPKPQPVVKPQPAPRPQVSRAPVDAAEKALADIKREEQRALATIEKRKAALDEEARQLRAGFRERRERCEKKLSDARKAYQQALTRR
jgi:hypothetical protein